MAIAAEGAAAHSQVEIVKAAKSPAVLELLGRYSCQHADSLELHTCLACCAC